MSSASLSTYSLLELTSAIVDNRGRSCPTVDSGMPLIATNCIKPDHLNPVFENVRYVDDETYASWFRAHPEPEDILFVCKGSPGRVAMVPDPVPFCIAQDMVALRANTDLVTPRYLYYLLKLPATRNAIENMHVGTMIPHFKKGDFKNLALRVHADLADQDAIAEVLGALDDKIAANRRLTSAADELSQAHFLEITQGAEEAPLSATAKFVNGKAFTKGASGTGRVVIRIAELNSGLGSSTVRSDIDVDDQYTARPGDILFAWSGSLTLHRWFRDEAIVNQHIFKVVPNEGIPTWLVYQLIAHKLPYFKDVAADKATTMGHIQRKHLDELVPIPPAQQIEEKSELMGALWERALLAEQEAENLTVLRDTLLPRLMSGELRVRDAEGVVSNAL